MIPTWNNMTPRERNLEKIKEIALAASIAAGTVWILVEGLTK